MIRLFGLAVLDGETSESVGQGFPLWTFGSARNIPGHDTIARLSLETRLTRPIETEFTTRELN